MKHIAPLLLLLFSTTASADWFKPSSDSMPELIEQGYDVVGFTTVVGPDPNRVFNELTSHRWTLQATFGEVRKVAVCFQHYNRGKVVNEGCLVSG